nr:hypothetical protein [Tanacetum cinerariifolium]
MFKILKPIGIGNLENSHHRMAATKNRGKAIVNSPQPIYDQEPSMVAEDDETSKDKEIDKLMALISLSGDGYENQRIGNVVGARETVGSTVELEAHYMYMAKLQEVSPDATDSGPIFDAEPVQKVSNDDHYNVFAIENEHPEQSESVHDTYHIEQDAHNMIINSLDMSYDREQTEHNDDDVDLVNKHELLASLIEKLKCEINDSKNRNKFLETSNKALIEKLKGEIEDFKNKNKSLESSSNRFKEANKKLSETNTLLYNDFKKSQAELKRRKSVEYASKVEIDSPESNEVIHLEKESRSKLSDLIRPFDYDKLNNLYDLFIPQHEKSSEQRYFLERSRLSHTPVNNGNSKESFNKHSILLEKRMDESISWEQKCKSSIELFKIKSSVGIIFDGVERCKETIAKRTYFGHIDPFIKNTIKANFSQEIRRINAGLEQFHVCLNKEMVADLRYFNSLKLEVDSLRSQLETQKTQFLNWIDRLSREYYYADHMNTILGVYTELDEDLKAQLHDKGIVISELKKLIEKLKGKSMDTKFEKSSVIRQPNAFKSQRQSILGKPTTFSNSLERKYFSKSKSVTQNNVSNDFSKPVTAQILPPNKKSILRNTNVLAPGMYKLHTPPTQARTSQLPQDSRKTNKCVSFSTGVIPTTSVSRPQLKSNRIEDRVLRNNSQGKKQDVEDHRRSVNFFKNKMSITACNDNLKTKSLNVNFVRATCGKCVLKEKHDMCVLKSVNGVHSRTKMPIALPVSTREPKRTVKQSDDKPLKKIVASESNQKPRNITRKLYERVSKTCSWWYIKFTPSGYKWKPKTEKKMLIRVPMCRILYYLLILLQLLEIVLFIVDSGCSKHMTGNLKLLFNFVEKFLGLNHNLFSVGQFCDADLEVAFRKSTCYIRDLKGNDLLTGSRGMDLYLITLQDTASPNLIYLMAKASSSQAWLWHRKAKRKSFHTKLTPSSKRWLQLLHMDLCGPIRVASINEKRYVLVIVDDYSRYTWTHFLRSKDETPEVLINFLRLVQRGLQAQVRIVRTDKGMEFLNQTLHAYFAAEEILHQTSVARTPEQNGIVERQNRTLVEAARTMLSAAKVPLFFWVEAIATACFTQIVLS